MRCDGHGRGDVRRGDSVDRRRTGRRRRRSAVAVPGVATSKIASKLPWELHMATPLAAPVMTTPQLAGRVVGHRPQIAEFLSRNLPRGDRCDGRQLPLPPPGPSVPGPTPGPAPKRSVRTTNRVRRPAADPARSLHEATRHGRDPCANRDPVGDPSRTRSTRAGESTAFGGGTRVRPRGVGRTA